jgi:hypothetical protein
MEAGWWPRRAPPPKATLAAGRVRSGDRVAGAVAVREGGLRAVAVRVGGGWREWAARVAGGWPPAVAAAITEEPYSKNHFQPPIKSGSKRKN